MRLLLGIGVVVAGVICVLWPLAAALEQAHGKLAVFLGTLACMALAAAFGSVCFAMAGRAMLARMRGYDGKQDG